MHLLHQVIHLKHQTLHRELAFAVEGGRNIQKQHPAAQLFDGRALGHQRARFINGGEHRVQFYAVTNSQVANRIGFTPSEPMPR